MTADSVERCQILILATEMVNDATQVKVMAAIALKRAQPAEIRVLPA